MTEYEQRARQLAYISYGLGALALSGIEKTI